MPTPDQLVELLRKGPLRASEVLSALQISPNTLSRLVPATNGRVVRIGRARATRYATVREVRGYGHSWNIYRIDHAGRPSRAATLRSLEPRAWWYDAAPPVPAWLYGASSSGLFADFPWFLTDLRPQGFLGHAFAQRYAGELGLGTDPRLWDADGVVSTLIQHGDDLPGDFVVGDHAMGRVQQATLRDPPSTDVAKRSEVYPKLASAALAGDVPASSAGGEQPKFTTCLVDRGEHYHAIVKFSPARSSPIGQRWADLLVCEHLALETLRDGGIDAANTEIVVDDSRTYLEAVRFDRVGAHGRRGLVSLFALESEYYGKFDDWHAAADRLERDEWLDADQAQVLRLLWWFARLILNTDLHFGNVSFVLGQSRPLALAPSYDMLPMHYRPASTGEVAMRDLALPLPLPGQESAWRTAADLALIFWDRSSQDTRISSPFRSEASRVLAALRTLRGPFA